MTLNIANNEEKFELELVDGCVHCFDKLLSSTW